jgi:hypothetical protein
MNTKLKQVTARLATVAAPGKHGPGLFKRKQHSENYDTLRAKLKAKLKSDKTLVSDLTKSIYTVAEAHGISLYPKGIKGIFMRGAIVDMLEECVKSIAE